MDKNTIETYDNGAEEFSKKFAGIGPRTKDIERMFNLCNKENPRVVEIGCGDGRDAVEICARTNNYVGIDPSVGMIELAKRKVPQATFVVSTVEEYEFSQGVDLIFAFASLLHVDKVALSDFFEKAYIALAVGGHVYVSVKSGMYKGSEVVSGNYGDRTFYYYTKEDLVESAKDFKVVYVSQQEIRGIEWIDMIFQKV